MVDSAFIAATRDSYDALAAEHAEVVASALDDRPLDRALLATFAELVHAGGNHSVADIGCGPGRVTVLLSQLGLDAFGIDLSPGMLALARRAYPELRFEEGSMLALELPDARNHVEAVLSYPDVSSIISVQARWNLDLRFRG